jgi:hypothetical protein
VIRLCKDERNITDFYNQLDGLLDLKLEVLDDFVGESREVQLMNPWLNYALPMHRCRELGYHDRAYVHELRLVDYCFVHSKLSLLCRRPV